jgi:hypothetical protein
MAAFLFLFVLLIVNCQLEERKKPMVCKFDLLGVAGLFMAIAGLRQDKTISLRVSLIQVFQKTCSCGLAASLFGGYNQTKRVKGEP